MTFAEYLRLIKYEERRFKAYGTKDCFSDDELYQIVKYLLSGVKRK